MSGNAKSPATPSHPDDPFEVALERMVAEWRVNKRLTPNDRALILALAARVSEERRTALLRDIAAELRTPSNRGGPVFEKVIRLVDERPEWKATEIKRTLANRGTPVDTKTLSNSIDYLVKSGRLRRLGRGTYAAPGFGIVTSEELTSDDIPRGGELED
jgi:hypothetical protein